MTDYTLRTPSQRYDRYISQMQKVKKLLELLRRCRFLLMAVGAVTLAAAVCFLFAVGSFAGDARCGDFLYGETPSCGLTAFLSDMRFQYAPANGEGVWSDAVPTEPGQYRIRVKAYVGEDVYELLSDPVTLLVSQG